MKATKGSKSIELVTANRQEILLNPAADVDCDCPAFLQFAGAAPIGLINGEKLLDLLIENEIGMRKRPAQLYELDEEFFLDGSETDEML